MPNRRTTLISLVSLACILFAPVAFSTPTAAATNVTIKLFGSKTGGWGFTNASLSIPGPSITLYVGYNVTLNMTSVDGKNHNWFIDYNNNSKADAGEPKSPNFGFATLWNFTVGNKTGKFVYRSAGPDTPTIWGNVTIQVASTPSGTPLGSDYTVLIVSGIVAAFIAALAIAAFVWRRKQRTPPPPPTQP